eukprot:6462978-Amphidinium_carterae.2
METTTRCACCSGAACTAKASPRGITIGVLDWADIHPAPNQVSRILSDGDARPSWQRRREERCCCRCCCCSSLFVVGPSGSAARCWGANPSIVDMMETKNAITTVPQVHRAVPPLCTLINAHSIPDEVSPIEQQFAKR